MIHNSKYFNLNKVYKLLKKDIDKLLEISKKAANNNSKEICGFIVDNGYFLELIHTRNKEKKGGKFSFYKSDIQNLQKATKVLNREIVGTFHSHPFGIAEPGVSDVKNTLDDSFSLIVDVMDQKIGLWHIKSLKKKKIRFKLI